MAKGAPARREHERSPGTQDRPLEARKPVRVKTPGTFDYAIHERMRFAIVSALASAQSLSFNELKDLLDTTDGNLSAHARRLEEAGFIACEKSFVGRVPRTNFQLTAAGRKALDDYLDHMETLIRRVREG